jgi:tetratricopeptide (TPR) repeat protein
MTEKTKIPEADAVELHERALALEKEAHVSRGEQKLDQAFEAFDQAGALYRHLGEHLKAALCYASAATCWNLHSGWQSMRNAATRHHLAAEEALKGGNYEYARSLFRDAALAFEREGDFESYLACFMASQHADARRSWEIVAKKERVHDLFDAGEEITWQARVLAFLRWTANAASSLLWGYGEYPFRALIVAVAVILGCALSYQFSGGVLVQGAIAPINFREALYMSVMTFTTVGYGDYLPSGSVQWVAMLEAISGITLIPLFLVALTRRYLRMYR